MRFRKLQIAAAIIVLLVILGAMYAQAAFITPPKQVPDQPKVQDSPTPAQSARPAESADPIVIASPTPNPSPTVEPATGRKPDCYTFLLVGLDEAASNTDTMMVGTLDARNHTLHIVSIPRDTLVDVTWGTKKINSVYHYPTGIKVGNETLKGVDALKYVVEQVVGFPIDSTIVVNLKAFQRLVDTIGGVDFDVPVNMNYDDPTQNLSIHVNKGLQHLSGSQALGVVRFRDGNDGSGYPNGDIGRIQTQQDFLKAVASQMLQLKNWDKIGEWMQIFKENVDTNLNTGNLIWYGSQFSQLKSEDINFDRIPGDDLLSIRGVSYVGIYVDDWLDVLNSTINPCYEPRTVADLDILVWNSKMQTATSTSGTTYNINSFSTIVPAG